MWHEMMGESIDQVVILISCEDGASQVFVKDPKDRSRTFQGIANAMATQWSNVVTLERWI